MPVVYSVAAINGRLNGLVTAIGGAGLLLVRAGGLNLVSLTMGTPCGTVSGGVLTFTLPIIGVATGTGTADNVVITTAAAATMISGFTVGIPLSGADVIIANGINSLVISAGQGVTVLSAQIIGS